MNKQSYISKYRAELMGISALGVLIVHTPQTDLCPALLQRVFLWCGMAVYIFIFLSGVGLYYSMSGRSEENSLGDFYRRRLSRMILPYLLIAGIWYGIIYLLLERNLWMFLYELSTISFWVEHSSPWFVAMLIPIYLVYPFYYRWIERGNRGRKTFLSCSCVIILLSALFYLSADLYNHLEQVLNSLWVFMLGNYYGKKIKQGSSLREFLVYFVVILLVVKTVPLQMVNVIGKLLLYSVEGLFVMVVAALVLEHLHCEVLCQVLRWFGRHSLELYLTNQFLIKAGAYFSLWELTEGGQVYALYGTMLLLGLILSSLFVPLEKRFVNIVLNRC